LFPFSWFQTLDGANENLASKRRLLIFELETVIETFSFEIPR